MSRANAVINIDVNTSGAAAELRKLQTQINSFSTALNKNNIAQGMAAKEYAQQLSAAVNAGKYFTAETVRMRTAASQLDNTLSKGKGTVAQYFSTWRKGSGGYAQMMSLASQRAATLQTQFMATGAAANGFTDALAIRPIKAFNSQMAVTTERIAIQRAMFQQATTSVVNFGKNTQWAGRQLMVGFTVPLTIFGAVAGKTFMDFEKQVISFKKVYGDAFTTPEELKQNLDAMKELSKEFTKYGIAVQDTMELAANAAAAGMKNKDLIDSTTQATRLATLGQMEQAKALETTIALQNAFGLSGDKLAKSVNFLNMVENQTVTTLQDLAEAIPRVAPVIKGLGGSVEDMAAMLTAMKEGGVSAAQGANALKSGLASLINPTDRAVASLSKMGINLDNIIQANRGDLMGTVQDFSLALKTLDKFGQQQVLENVFGKYQYARLGALFQNITKEGTQASRVLDMVGMSSSQMAAVANKELGIIEESAAIKFTAAMERLKLALVPIGEMFVKIATPVVELFTRLLRVFDSLPDSVKKIGALGTIIVGVLVPAGTMFLGLLMNLVGTLAKFIHLIGIAGKGFIQGGFGGAVKAISQSLKYMSLTEMDAVVAAQQLGVAAQHAGTAIAESVAPTEASTAAIMELATAYANLAARMEAAAMASPAFANGAAAFNVAGRAGRTPIRMRYIARAKGGETIVPGVGNKDSVPAVLTPGEFVVNKKATSENLSLLHAINNGQIQGFNRGGQAVPIFSLAQNAMDQARSTALGNVGARVAESRLFNQTDWLIGSRNKSRMPKEMVDGINRTMAELLRDSFGFRGGGADTRFIREMPYGVAAIDKDLNNLLRQGKAPISRIIANHADTGHLNPYAPLFNTEFVSSNLSRIGKNPLATRETLAKTVLEMLIEEQNRLASRGAAPLLSDRQYSLITRKAFEKEGLMPLWSALRAETGARRYGFETDNPIRSLFPKGYSPLITSTFNRMNLPYETRLGAGRKTEYLVYGPDGKPYFMRTSETLDVEGMNSYQRIGGIPKGRVRAHFMGPDFEVQPYATGGIAGLSQSLRSWATSSQHVRSNPSLLNPLLKLIGKGRTPKDLTVARRTTVGLSKGSEFSPEVAKFLLKATPEELNSITSLAMAGPFSTTTGRYAGIDPDVSRINFLREQHAKNRKRYQDDLKMIASLEKKIAKGSGPIDLYARQLEERKRSVSMYRDSQMSIGREIKRLAPNGYRIIDMMMNIDKGTPGFKMNNQSYMGRSLNESEWVFGSGNYRISGIKGYANGGIASSDTVPAMLTPGEFVVNKDATQKNLGLLHAINGGHIQGFVKGGLVEAGTDKIQQPIFRDRRGRLVYEDGTPVPKNLIPARRINGDTTRRQRFFSRGSGGMGVSMGIGAVGGALMMAPLIPGVAQNEGLSNMAGAAGMGLSFASMIPMLAGTGPIGITLMGLAAAATAAGFAIKNMMESQDEASRKAAEFGANLGMTSNALKNVASLLGTTTPVERQSQLTLGFTQESMANAADKFSGIMQGEGFQKFLDELKAATSPERMKKLTDYMRSAVASGMMSKKNAQEFSRVIGLVLQDPSLGAGVAQAIAGQRTGSRALLGLAENRAQIAAASPAMRAVLADNVTAMGGQESSQAIGSAIQVIQDAANAEAYAREQFTAGQISFTEYNDVVDQARALQNEYNGVIVTAMQNTNDFGSTMQAVQKQLVEGGFLTSEQWAALDASATKVEESAAAIDMSAITVQDIATGTNAGYASNVDRSQWSSVRVTGGATAAYGPVTLEEYMQKSAAALGAVGPALAETFRADLTSAIAANPGSISNYADVARRIAGDENNAPDQNLIAMYNQFRGMSNITPAGAFDATLLREQILGGQVSGIGTANKNYANVPVRRDQYGNPLSSAVNPLQTRQNATNQRQRARTDAAMTDYVSNGGTAAAFSTFLSSIPEKKRIKVVAQFEDMDQATREAWQSDFYTIQQQLGPDLATKITLTADWQAGTPTEREDIKQAIDYLNNLPVQVDKTLVYDTIMKQNGGDTVTPRQAAKAVAEINDAWNTLNTQGSKKEAKKEAYLTLATYEEVNGKPVGPGQAKAAWQTLIDEFGEKKIYSLPPDVVTKVMSLSLEIVGVDQVIQQMDRAMALMQAGKIAFSSGEATGAAMQKNDSLAQKRRLMKQIANQIKMAGTTTPQGGGGGGGGTKTLSIIEQLKKDLKDLKTVFAGIRNLVRGNDKNFKNLMAGPFAPEFIEYLKSQGDRGIKMLKEQGSKFQQAYKLFVQQQIQANRNFLQRLPMSLAEQTQEVMGKNRATKTLADKGMSDAVIEQYLGGLAPGTLAAYNRASTKKKNLTTADKRVLAQINNPDKRTVQQAQRLAYESGAASLAGQGQSYDRVEAFNKLKISPETRDRLIEMGLSADMAAKYVGKLAAKIAELDKRGARIAILDQITQIKRDAATNKMIEGLGFSQEVTDTLKGLPDIWRFSADEVKAFGDQIKDALAVSRKLSEIQQDIRDNAMEINDTQREIAEIEIIKPMQDALDSLQDQSDVISRNIELRQRELEVIDDQIDKLEEQRDKINKAYDERVAALDEMEKANERVNATQQAQLGIAQALSRGDVAGAATAAQQLQQELAANRRQETRDALEMQNKMQNKAIDEQVNALKDKRKVIETDIKNMELQQRAIQDQIYTAQQAINAETARLDGLYNNSNNRLLTLKATLEDLLAKQKELNAEMAKATGGGGATVAAPAPTETPTAPKAGDIIGNGMGSWIAISSGPHAGQVYDPIHQIYRAKGGWIPKGSDTVPVMATPREFIVNSSAASRFGPLLEAINSNAFPSMSFGGLRTGKPVSTSSGMQYNYEINVNLSGRSDLNPDDIANAIMTKIQRVQDRQIRSYNY